MKIELRKIELSLRMSQETYCFVADLYINDLKAGQAENSGHGGPTSYSPIYDGDNKVGTRLIQEAEAYCLTLPAEKYEDFEIPMTLELFIDTLIESEVQKKEKAKTLKKLEKDCLMAICWGNREQIESMANTSWMMMKWKMPIATILHRGGETAIKKVIADVKSKLKERESILNTNLPDGYL